MPNEIDKSLLDRLQALRGSSEPPESTAPKISVDTIERSKTPTREDTLAARLKSLRSREDGAGLAGSSVEKSVKSVDPEKVSEKPAAEVISEKHASPANRQESPPQDEMDDSMFQTDDTTLEELLGDVSPEDGFAAGDQIGRNHVEPSDEQVKALLEQLSDSVPKDDATVEKRRDRDGEEEEDDDGGGDSDDSDGEKMGRKVDDVLARFKDEAEVEAALGRGTGDDGDEEQEDESEPDEQQADDDGPPDPSITLPSVPSDPNQQPSSSSSPSNSQSTTIDSLSARLSALRASSTSPTQDSLLPSVPTSRPSKADPPVKRLTSTTNYTDDDVDSWCTVCLEDATLQCKGCDDDPYCARCWREMHVGPEAGFDERTHRAVQFTRDKKKKEEAKRKVALGA